MLCRHQLSAGSEALPSALQHIGQGVAAALEPAAEQLQLAGVVAELEHLGISPSQQGYRNTALLKLQSACSTLQATSDALPSPAAVPTAD